MTARLGATPPGVPLGPLAEIADGQARGYVLQLRAGRFHGFVVRQGGAAHGYVDRCPHAGLPLALELDRYVAEGVILCGWHGAAFRITDGACLAGPCTGAALTPWPVTVTEGTIVTA